MELAVFVAGDYVAIAGLRGCIGDGCGLGCYWVGLVGWVPCAVVVVVVIGGGGGLTVGVAG